MEIELFVNGASQGYVQNLKIVSGEEMRRQMGGVKSNMVKGSNEKQPDHVIFETATPQSPFGKFALKLPNGIIIDIRVEEVRNNRVQGIVLAKRSGAP